MSLFQYSIASIFLSVVLNQFPYFDFYDKMALGVLPCEAATQTVPLGNNNLAIQRGLV